MQFPMLYNVGSGLSARALPRGRGGPFKLSEAGLPPRRRRIHGVAGVVCKVCFAVMRSDLCTEEGAQPAAPPPP